jgi:hypothetical protein
MTPTMKLIFILIEVLVTIVLFYFFMKQETKMKQKYIVGVLVSTVVLVVTGFFLFS